MKYPLAEEKEDYDLPQSCVKGRCWDCLYSAGIPRSECPINEGDAEFEGRGKSMGGVKPPFEPYDLKDGPLYSLPKDFPGLSEDHNSVRLTNRSQKSTVMRELNAHHPEPGEKIGGGRETHTYEGKQKPKRKIYSILK